MNITMDQQGSVDYVLCDSNIDRPDSLNIDEAANIKDSAIDIKYEVVPVLKYDIEHSVYKENSKITVNEEKPETEKDVKFKLETESDIVYDVVPVLDDNDIGHSLSEEKSHLGKVFESKAEPKSDHLETLSDINPLCEAKLETSSDINPLCEAKLETSSDIKPLCEFKLKRKYKCTLCSDSFEEKDQLYEHKVIHLKIFKYKCTLCSDSFEKKDQLYEHKVIHLKIIQVD